MVLGQLGIYPNSQFQMNYNLNVKGKNNIASET